MKHPWLEADELQKSGTPFVVVTLIAVKGHAPQDPGAKALVTADGLYAGTVGGGKVEAKCIEESKLMLQTQQPGSQPKVLHWNLQRDVGMSCGGEVTFLFEQINPAPWRVVVFGAGHIAQSLARILRPLQCRATFIDSRKEWLDRLPKAPNIEAVHLDQPKDYIEQLRLQNRSSSTGSANPYFICVMTKGHATDIVILREVLTQMGEVPYLGVIGSKVKAIKIRNELKAEGYSPQLVEKLRCPMGLTLGTNDPPEIAISIIAELIQVRDRLLGEQLPGKSGKVADDS